MCILLALYMGRETHVSRDYFFRHVNVSNVPYRLPGPPLSADSLIGHLVKRGVTVGVGPHGVTSVGHPSAQEMANSRARNLRFDVGEVGHIAKNTTSLLCSHESAGNARLCWMPA